MIKTRNTFSTAVIFSLFVGLFASNPAVAGRCTNAADACLFDAWSTGYETCTDENFQNSNKCTADRVLHVFVNNESDNLQIEVEDDNWYTGFHQSGKFQAKNVEYDDSSFGTPTISPNSNALFSLQFDGLSGDITNGYITLNVYQVNYDDGSDAGKIFLGKHRIAVRPQTKSGNKLNYVCSYFDSATPRCLQTGSDCVRGQPISHGQDEPNVNVHSRLACQHHNHVYFEMAEEIQFTNIDNAPSTSSYQEAKGGDGNGATWITVNIEGIDLTTGRGSNGVDYEEIPYLQTDVGFHSAPPCTRGAFYEFNGCS